MTPTGELPLALAMSVAPEQIRVSVMGRHTQLDVTLPVDVPVASLLPQLVTLVRSRDVEAPTNTPWPAPRHTFWVLSRLESPAPMQPNETLRSAGVIDGELLRLAEERAPLAPILYDDVVDAAARLNKAAYAGWNAAAARWMSLAGIAVASLVWVYFLVAWSRPIIVGLAAVVVAGMLGAALAHRVREKADVAATLGWSTIPICAAIGWTLLHGLGEYGLAAGCALLVVVNVASCWATGAARWGYVASAVFFAGAALALLSDALGVSARTVGVVWAVSAALGCLAVSWLTAWLARIAPSPLKSEAGDDAVLDNPFTARPSTGPGDNDAAAAAMPTADAVWARVDSAQLSRSALYTGLAVSVVCGAAVVLRAGMHWAALVFAGITAAALAAHTRVPGNGLERVSLGVPAAVLLAVGCVSAQAGTPPMAWAGLATLLAVAPAATVTGLRVAGKKPSHRWATACAYLHYAVFAMLIPAALWAAGVYPQLEVG